MSDAELVSFLKEHDLILVSRSALQEFTIDARLATQVDLRVKWITAKQAISKYGLTKYWLQKAESDAFSLLKVSKGSGVTSTKKYNEQSIIDEQERISK